MSFSMDDVDAGIVDLLQADARLTQAQIAKKVGPLAALGG